ncbi:MAG: hypothetical protein FWB85_05235 [Chitinispirillia bacterium]|nr:hypothetical protein [Chitinispirillia bacterium]
MVLVRPGGGGAGYGKQKNLDIAVYNILSLSKGTAGAVGGGMLGDAVGGKAAAWQFDIFAKKYYENILKK